jgi:transposase
MTQSIVNTDTFSSTAKASTARGTSVVLPEPEVTVMASRRRFSAQYKRQILEQADRCSAPGEIGALLRREGLYSSHLSKWRHQREQGAVSGLTPRKRGPKVSERSAESVRVAQLERDNAALRAQLEQAELIIDVQKKYLSCWGSHYRKTRATGTTHECRHGVNAQGRCGACLCGTRCESRQLVSQPA